MKQVYKTIDYEWLTKPTGDPFADAGGFAIEYLSERSPEKDILELIKEVSNIYIDQWNAGLHVFFLNSTITQSAKGFQTHEEKKAKTINYFMSLLNESAPYSNGVCRVIGQRTKLFRAGRENSLLTGSGTFLNFHHNLESGIMLSKEALIRFFFVPVASIMIYDKMGIIHSNQEEVIDYFIKKNVSENIKNSLFRFTLRSKYQNPATALFAFVDDLLSNVKIATDETKKLSLTLFHFSNFGASPTTEIYKVPASLFDFYRVCKSICFSDQWRLFINAHYIKYPFYKANFDKESNTYIEKVKEVSGIGKVVFEKLEKDESLNFALCQFGRRTDSKTNEDYIVVDSGELKNWKNGKLFKEWKKNDEKGAKEFSDATRKIKEDITLTYNVDDFSYKWINLVYSNLIEGKSIISLILKWSEKNLLDFRITRNYQQIIKGMNTKTLDLIEKITNYLIKDESDLKKKKSKLQTTKSHELRSFLIKQIEKNYKEGNSEPLITLRDYVGYLFPDGTNWMEIRDLMLICFYQKLHEKGIQMEIEDEIDNQEEVVIIEDENNE
jgi:CRISPR-associated protein Cst1